MSIFIRTMQEPAKIVFLDDVLTELYEATEEGAECIDDILFRKDQQINVELMQENNDRYQVLFVDEKEEPIGWLKKSDIKVI